MSRRPELPEPVHEVDLHGLTVARALARVEAELTFCRARRMSPVLIITGRGWGNPDGRSRLAPAVRAWLEGREGRALGVRECRAVHDGGAFWVRLERAGT